MLSLSLLQQHFNSSIPVLLVKNIVLCTANTDMFGTFDCIELNRTTVKVHLHCVVCN